MARRKSPKRRPGPLGSPDGGLRIRLIGLGVLLMVLVGMLLFSFWMRTSFTAARSDTPSILDQEISGVQFQPDATSEDILEAARTDVDGLVKKYPSNAPALSASARLAYQTGDTERCIEDWGKSLDERPHFTEALYGLGLLAFDDDRYEDAAHYFEDIGIIDPGDARVPVMLSDSLLQFGQVRKAILQLEQHVAVEQTSVDALVLLGQAYEQDKKTERAIMCFTQVIKNEPNSKDGHYGLSRAYRRTGQKELAEEYNKKFRDLAQRDREQNAVVSIEFSDRDRAAGIASLTYIDIARIEQQLGHSLEAEEWLLKAIKLEPEQETHLRALQPLLIRQGRKSDAIDVVERITELSPDDVAAWFTLGGLYADLELADQAISAFKKAIELDPSNELCIQAQQMMDSLK